MHAGLMRDGTGTPQFGDRNDLFCTQSEPSLFYHANEAAHPAFSALLHSTFLHSADRL